MRRLVLALALFGMVGGLALGSVSVAGSAPSHPSTAGLSPTLQVRLAPVDIAFASHVFHGVQGGDMIISANVTNNGTKKFVAGGCDLWFRTGGSGGWTMVPHCFKKVYFPLTFDPGTVFTIHVAQHVSSTFPTGFYQWKVILFGKYGALAEQSHPGFLNVQIT